MAKVSKASVNYRRGEGGRICANCTMFRPPGACSYVEGNISPQGLCDAFDPKGDTAKAMDRADEVLRRRRAA